MPILKLDHASYFLLWLESMTYMIYGSIAYVLTGISYVFLVIIFSWSCDIVSCAPYSYGITVVSRKSSDTSDISDGPNIWWDLTNLNRIYKAHRTNVWWTMKVFRPHWYWWRYLISSRKESIHVSVTQTGDDFMYSKVILMLKFEADEMVPMVIRCLWQEASHYMWHYNVIMGTVASQITTLLLSTQPFIQSQIKENIKAPCHWPLCGEFTGTGEFPTQMASKAENVSIWWRHYGSRKLW